MVKRPHDFIIKPACTFVVDMNTRLILVLRPVNERRRYFVTTSLIGWTQT